MSGEAQRLRRGMGGEDTGLEEGGGGVDDKETYVMMMVAAGVTSPVSGRLYN